MLLYMLGSALVTFQEYYLLGSAPVPVQAQDFQGPRANPEDAGEDQGPEVQGQNPLNKEKPAQVSPFGQEPAVLGALVQYRYYP